MRATVLLVLAVVGDALTATRPPPTTAKAALLRVLDEELATGVATDGRRIDKCASTLEKEATALVFPRDLPKVDGVWRLLFTNNAPQPSFGFPASFGGAPFLQVPKSTAYQTIDSQRNVVTNSVCFDAAGGDVVERIPVVGRAMAQSAVRFDLEHSLLLDDAHPSRVRIALKEIKRQVDGPADDLPGVLKTLLFDNNSLKLPDLLANLNSLLPSDLDAGSFDTTFCDDSIRISRGRFNTLRIFERCDTGIPPLTGLSGSSSGSSQSTPPFGDNEL